MTAKDELPLEDGEDEASDFEEPMPMEDLNRSSLKGCQELILVKTNSDKYQLDPSDIIPD
jgi:hypothetical protein